MCQLEVIKCKLKECNTSCALSVIFCERVIATHGGRKYDYYLMTEPHIRKREGCNGHQFLSAKKTSHHTCFECDPDEFADMNFLLAKYNGDIFQTIWGEGRWYAKSSTDPFGPLINPDAAG